MLFGSDLTTSATFNLFASVARFFINFNRLSPVKNPGLDALGIGVLLGTPLGEATGSLAEVDGCEVDGRSEDAVAVEVETDDAMAEEAGCKVG